jgi:putative aldouronate transport system permease protein
MAMAQAARTASGPPLTRKPDSLWRRLGKDFARNKVIYLMLAPVVGYYLVFHYGPMYGAQIAFRDFEPALGILGSKWVGWQNFKEFFTNPYFSRLIRNTLSINVMDLVLGFPAPIILAILVNEIRHTFFKSVVNTISYLPHFISLVVVVGMLLDFFNSDGLINQLLAPLGGKPILWFQRPEFFQPLYVLSGIWQSVGWGSIIYLAAIANIDPALYEAAQVDGAGRLRQILNITLPGMAPTIILLLILRLGQMMTVGYEKIILMYNPVVYSTADVISTYVYRKGILEMNYSFSSAAGLFNSAINFTLLILANKMSQRMSESSLW